MLPQHVRLLLLSATVGNAAEFLNWLERCHGRKLELVEGKERKVPLTYHWVPDQFLNEQLVEMAKGDAADAQDAGPGLLLQPRRVLERGRAAQGAAAARRRTSETPLHAEVNKLDWTQGVGPEAEADAAPRRRRPPRRAAAEVSPRRRGPVRAKLLAVVVCTETLAPASTCRPGRWC